MGEWIYGLGKCAVALMILEIVAWFGVLVIEIVVGGLGLNVPDGLRTTMGVITWVVGGGAFLGSVFVGSAACLLYTVALLARATDDPRSWKGLVLGVTACVGAPLAGLVIGGIGFAVL